MKKLWGEIGISAAAYAALFFALSYPLFRSPGSTLVHPSTPWGDADINLVIWILCWGWHALTGRAESLFDANIFHPAEQTFASSEHLLGYAPLFGPVYELTANPVLANQVSILLSIAISGAGMYGLLRHWRVPIAGAFFGGFINAFFPSRFAGLGEPQMLATGFLPIALVYLDRLLASGRLRSSIGLAVFTLWQMLCSVYLAFIALLGLAAYGIAIVLTLRTKIRARGMCAAIAALLVVGVSLAFVHRPYTDLRARGVIPEYGSAGRMSVYSNGLVKNYITRPQQIRSGTTHLNGGRLLYVGLLPAIGILGLFLRRYRGEPRWAVFGGFALAISGYVLGLGPKAQFGEQIVVLPYAYMGDIIPGFSSMRVPSRFGFLFMMGISALAALGTGRILERAVPEQRWIRAGAIFAILAVTIVDYDLHATRIQTREVASLPSTIPEVYRRIAGLPSGPVLEVPIPKNPLFRDHSASVEMYYSTFHWRPLLNGYTGYASPSYDLIQAVAAELPKPDALALLCRMTGVRYIVSGHAPSREEWTDPPGLERIGRFGKTTLFEVDRPCHGESIEQIRQPSPWSETIEGTPLQPIAPPSSAALRYIAKPPLGAKRHRGFRVTVEVANQSNEVWPALAPIGSDVVAVGYRWESEDGSVHWPLREDLPRVALFPRDVPPGTRTPIEVGVDSPVRPGPHWLVVGLSQGGRWITRMPERIRVDIE